MMKEFDKHRSRELCPCCWGLALKVIYAGLPMRLCMDEGCQTLWGFWSWVPTYCGFTGGFMVYNGAYLPALWHWLKRKPE